jgi:site-specific DNA-cytosine methylase
MDWEELPRCRADRPVRTHPVRGRPLQCLELFSGCGVVTQEFADRKWTVRSVDTDRSSNATDKVSVMDLDVEFRSIGFVPDFIWASPPCFTYSNMAGGRHRQPEAGLYEKTAEAHEHNHYFVKMAELMEAAKRLHPHLIVVIENPVGAMSKVSSCICQIFGCALEEIKICWLDDYFLELE